MCKQLSGKNNENTRLIASDDVAIPVAPDLFSLQGLRNLGPALRGWRSQWNDRKERAHIDREAHKPMFFLKPADGAIGAHMQAVLNCREDFRMLARRLAAGCGVEIGSVR